MRWDDQEEVGIQRLPSLHISMCSKRNTHRNRYGISRARRGVVGVLFS